MTVLPTLPPNIGRWLCHLSVEYTRNLQLFYAVQSRGCSRRAVFHDRDSGAGRLVRLAFGTAVTLTLAGRRQCDPAHDPVEANILR